MDVGVEVQIYVLTTFMEKLINFLAWKQNIIDQPDNGIICSFILFAWQFWKLPLTALN
jgi:hypothetical protein